MSPLPALAQATTAIPPSITTPDKVETRLGTLDFKDGMPSPATWRRSTTIWISPTRSMRS